MKYLALYTLLLLAIAACADPAEEPSSAGAAATQAPAPAEARKLFARPKHYPPGTLREAAEHMLRAREALSTEEAERCRKEDESGTTGELCLLLWAHGKEESAELSRELLRRAPQSKVAAFALGARPGLLRGFSLDHFVATLGQLVEQPLWLTSGLVQEWIQLNGPAGGEAALKALQVKEPLGPEDLRVYFSLLFDEFPAQFDSRLREYCRLEATGEARFRCWRLLGALERTRDELRSRLRAFAPTAGDPTWNHFRASFPELAFSIQKTFSTERK